MLTKTAKKHSWTLPFLSYDTHISFLLNYMILFCNATRVVFVVVCFVFFCCWTFSHINNRCRPQDSNLCSYIVASFWNLEPIGRKGRGRTVFNVSKCLNQENHNATTWSDPRLTMLNSIAETYRIVTNGGGLLEHKHFARMLFKGGGVVAIVSFFSWVVLWSTPTFWTWLDAVYLVYYTTSSGPFQGSTQL